MEDTYARMTIKPGIGPATIPVSASHNNGDWLPTDIYENELYVDVSTMDLYIRVGDEIRNLSTSATGVNIYNSDDSLTGPREVDGASNTLAFVNMLEFGALSEVIGFLAAKQLFLAGSNPGTAPTDAGVEILATAPDPNDVAFALTNDTAQMFQMFGNGALGAAVSLILGSGNVPADPSLILDVQNSGNRLSRVWPLLTPFAIASLSGVLPHSACINGATGYPQFYHPTYGWSGMSYGSVRVSVNFATTPLDSGNSYKITLPTSVPADKIVHKMVLVGTDIADPNLDTLEIGLDSQSDYAMSAVATLNSPTGDVSTGNSARTGMANEVLIVRTASGSGPSPINSGTLEIVIFHT